MAESYTDEELLSLTFTDPVMFNTIVRLQREREDAQRVASEVPGMSATIDELRWERDESRRVAKVLADAAQPRGVDLTGDELEAICDALAYPEPKSTEVAK